MNTRARTVLLTGRATFFALVLLCATLALIHRPSRAAAPREHFAMLVGIDHYRNEQYDILKAPGHDVALMQKLLVERYGFLADNAHMKSLIGYAATRQAILGGLDTFLLDAARAHPGAEIVLFYSGHGSQTADGLHQTIVSSDGRTGDVQDIRDDELSRRFDQLRRYTTNITFVFDSCYSSTLIRALDSKRIARSIPPAHNAPSTLIDSPGAGSMTAKDILSGSGNPNDEYVAISAALPAETAWEGCLPAPPGTTASADVNCAGGSRSYGYLTYNLYRVLSADPTQTYHDAVNAVTAGINGSQHPTAQGDVGRLVFNGPGSRTDPYIEITGRHQLTISLAAGRSLGLDEGALLAVYTHSTLRLRGSTGLLTGAHVVRSNDFSAEALVDHLPRAGIPADAKVVLVAPNRASQLRVRLPQTAKTNATFLKTVREGIASDPTLEIASGRAWDVAVTIGCIASSGTVTHSPSCRTSSYLATPDRDAPLFDLTVDPSAPKSAAATIVLALDRAAKQRSVRALANPRSSFAGKLLLRIIRVVLVNESDGTIKVASSQVLDPRRTASLPQGQAIRLEVQNTSEQDASVALLDLGTSGIISMLSPEGVALRIPGGSTYVSDRAWKIGGPAGIETFEMIGYAYRGAAAPADLSMLEQPGISTDRTKAIGSPLSLLALFSVTRTKDVGPAITLTPSSWTTDRVDVAVTP